MTQQIINKPAASTSPAPTPAPAKPTLEQRIEALEKQMGILQKHNGHFFAEKVEPAAATETKKTETEKVADAVKTDQQRMTGLSNT